MLRDGGRERGEGVSPGTSLAYDDFRYISLPMNCFFSVCPILILSSASCKNEAVSNRHLTRNFDVARFCCQNCLLHVSLYHLN